MDMFFDSIPYAIGVVVAISAIVAGFFLFRLLSKKFDGEKLAAFREVKYFKQQCKQAMADKDAAIEVMKETMNSSINQALEEKRAAIEEHKKIADKRTETALDAMKILTQQTHENLISNITSSNLSVSRKKLDTVIEIAAAHGLKITAKSRKALQDELQAAFEKVVRKEAAKQEQNRIKAQIREEERLEAERQRELERLKNQESAIELALEKALRKAREEHTEEVMRLEALLAEAREKLQRAISQAQLTRAGYVYVLSNIGSFGQDVYKIGMTRRLVPMDRVRELGDASVPFPFDVHMMISCQDAPKLENVLHREFDGLRLNRVNFRKEFFRVTLDKIRVIVEKNHGEVDYVADPDAIEYRESMAMTTEDYQLRSKLIPAEAEVE